MLPPQPRAGAVAQRLPRRAARFGGFPAGCVCSPRDGSVQSPQGWCEGAGAGSGLVLGGVSNSSACVQQTQKFPLKPYKTGKLQQILLGTRGRVEPTLRASATCKAPGIAVLPFLAPLPWSEGAAWEPLLCLGSETCELGAVVQPGAASSPLPGSVLGQQRMLQRRHLGAAPALPGAIPALIGAIPALPVPLLLGQEAAASPGVGALTAEQTGRKDIRRSMW